VKRYTQLVELLNDIMRRILLVLVALFIGFGSVSAKKRKEVKSDLVGVWQQAGTMDGKLKQGQY